jgi:hypothetical protein
MGGINCPPLANQASQSYTMGLAGYCGPLFQGIADFYAANARIEVAVQKNDHTLAGTCDLFDNSKSGLEEARTKFGTFISLHQADAPNIDPDTFIEALDSAVTCIDTVTFEVDAMQNSGTVQGDLWASGLTKAMTSAAEAIIQVQRLQVAFANAGQYALHT